MEQKNRLLRAVDRVGPHLLRPGITSLMRFVPTMPHVRKPFRPVRGAWNTELPPIPDELKTVPGVWRDPEAEQAAFEEKPLTDWGLRHHKSTRWLHNREWASFLPIRPRFTRAVRACIRTGSAKVAPQPAAVDPEQLKRALFARAAELGISAVGIAPHDEKYTYAEYHGAEVGDRVIACVLEQNYEAMATLPSRRQTMAVLSCYADLMRLMAQLASFLHSQGYRARAEQAPGRGIDIQYAVQAGLGQLGLNGQLLTPTAGSRIRIGLIETDAPLPFDEPVDYGLQTICDKCQACVRRCPVGAIPNKRAMYRGIMKAKINSGRCFPFIAQTYGCAICAKVCPVQRYGLTKVLEEYGRSGEILGKGTDELEGYDYEGRHYGPEEKPRIEPDFFEPRGLDFDPDRETPVIKERSGYFM